MIMMIIDLLVATSRAVSVLRRKRKLSAFERNKIWRVA